MPVAEMWLLITVGSQIGALPTIGLVLLTAVVGAGLLREQGFATKPKNIEAWCIRLRNLSTETTDNTRNLSNEGMTARRILTEVVRLVPPHLRFHPLTVVHLRHFCGTDHSCNEPSRPHRSCIATASTSGRCNTNPQLLPRTRLSKRKLHSRRARNTSLIWNSVSTKKP